MRINPEQLEVHQIDLEMQTELLRQTQIALEEARDQYADFYDFAPVGCLTITHPDRIVDINLTGTTLLGAERGKLLQHRFSHSVADVDRDNWHRHRLRALADKLAEAVRQLLQSERLPSIGQLAAGVAHELNNPIGFVRSNLGTLRNYIRDLKDFSHAGEAESQLADLHRGLDLTLNLVNNELKYKCTVIKDYGELQSVWCIPAQINQVFLNLLLNASQSIPEVGEITLRTGQLNHDVFVSVADTGSGVPVDHLSRLFEPFFTTKAVGKGTGLDLSLSCTIVQKHLGRIEVQSEVGKGTTFTV